MKLRMGQVLVEILLAMAVASVALVGMAQIATKSLGNASYSASNTDADKYTSKLMEYIRSQRNQMAWSDFYALSGTKCVSLDPFPLLKNMGSTCTCPYLQDHLVSNYNTGDPGVCIHSTPFKANVTFTPSGNTQTINVAMSWNNKGVTSTTNQTIIFKQY